MFFHHNSNYYTGIQERIFYIVQIYSFCLYKLAFIETVPMLIERTKRQLAVIDKEPKDTKFE